MLCTPSCQVFSSPSQGTRRARSCLKTDVNTPTSALYTEPETLSAQLSSPLSRCDTS
ncbi:hypothetical protein K435DRAFT_392053 [Dendrothele bispora CBS 962.96]|uniref:Uncharacterized protein n=1 Tax=Dendrothele bispora (strain CBS 962.96) TaxID=1314807 RepID=A0A4S8L9E7_DENBC|nr:hypothetical protein K435DRAFT_392053 [Dendrothele bispora CBS 962.96]